MLVHELRASPSLLLCHFRDGVCVLGVLLDVAALGPSRLDLRVFLHNSAEALRRPRADSLHPTQEIASILLNRGSLAFAQLTRLSSLPPSTIHSCLLILSLHSLLYHSESEVNGKLLELYEINELGVQRRMRGGVYVEMAREWDESSVLDEVIESLWRDGMQKRDMLIETGARKLIEKYEREERLREADAKGKPDSHAHGKGKGKAKIPTMQTGESRRVASKGETANVPANVSPDSGSHSENCRIQDAEESLCRRLHLDRHPRLPTLAEFARDQVGGGIAPEPQG
jgi:hypothetical protein